jgi:hypothetical protein
MASKRRLAMKCVIHNLDKATNPVFWVVRLCYGSHAGRGHVSVRPMHAVIMDAAVWAHFTMA